MGQIALKAMQAKRSLFTLFLRLQSLILHPSGNWRGSRIDPATRKYLSGNQSPLLPSPKNQKQMIKRV